MKKLLTSIILIFLMVTLIACNPVNNADLISYSEIDLSKISDNIVEQMNYTEKFVPNDNSAFYDFTADLISSINEDKNSLVSSLSIYLALAMIINGAKGDTLDEFIATLGLSQNQINAECNYIINSLKTKNDSIFKVANSIWINSNSSFVPNNDFLDFNALYYDAEIYKDDFTGSPIIDNINSWVNINTNGMIKKMVEEIDSSTIMLLFNTLYFECQWQFANYEYNIYDFTNSGGEVKSIDFFQDKTNIYYHSDSAKAVKINLKDNYYFLGILPNDNDIDNYLESFDGNELYQLINNSSSQYDVLWRLPKFSYDYETSIKGALLSMGIIKAFDEDLANFTGMGTANGNIFVQDIIHKTRIELDKYGIKAAAVTEVIMEATSISPKPQFNIYFDRPFVYVIMDSVTNTPLFTGVVKYL